MLAIQVNEVDRESHTDGVNRFTGKYPQTFICREVITPEQAFPALCPMIGHLDTAGEHSLARKVRDLQMEIRLCLTLSFNAADAPTTEPVCNFNHCCEAPFCGIGICEDEVIELSIVNGCSGFMA
jgi:hypothetical protein